MSKCTSLVQKFSTCHSFRSEGVWYVYLVPFPHTTSTFPAKSRFQTCRRATKNGTRRRIWRSLSRSSAAWPLCRAARALCLETHRLHVPGRSYTPVSATTSPTLDLMVRHYPKNAERGFPDGGQIRWDPPPLQSESLESRLSFS